MISLKVDLYAVNGALRYSSFGGIYTADDTLLKRKVVLREARPHAVLAKKRLLFEAALLKALAPLRRTPEFIDLFTEHGHTYLVQSRLSTVTLWGMLRAFWSHTSTIGRLPISWTASSPAFLTSSKVLRTFTTRDSF